MVRVASMAFGLACLFVAGPVLAQSLPPGPVTGLPIPRYVSLKSDRVNLREGPSKDHRTRWVYQRAGLPVEIVAEFETWRRVRDSDGAEGWVLHSLLSGRRTAMVEPWSREREQPVPMLRQPQEGAAVVAQLGPGVITSVDSCSEGWCRVTAQRLRGFVKQERLGGVYPNENVD